MGCNVCGLCLLPWIHLSLRSKSKSQNAYTSKGWKTTYRRTMPEEKRFWSLSLDATNRHGKKQKTCTLTPPSFRVQEDAGPPFSSPPGFTELAYIWAEQSSKSHREQRGHVSSPSPLKVKQATRHQWINLLVAWHLFILSIKFNSKGDCRFL